MFRFHKILIFRFVRKRDQSFIQIEVMKIRYLNKLKFAKRLFIKTKVKSRALIFRLFILPNQPKLARNRLPAEIMLPRSRGPCQNVRSEQIMCCMA